MNDAGLRGAFAKVAVEELEACNGRLAVEAPADVVQKEWERAYGRVQKQARLPGFRKGHVPRSLVKLHFADDVRREVAEHLIPDVYRQALTEARLDPVNEPDLQEVKLEENAPLSFVAVVEVKPAIALTDYKGVEVQHAPSTVGDDEVAATLEQMREQQAEFRAVDRPAAVGDLAVVDYTLRPEAHEATTANGYHFVIGSGAVMPEIDGAAVGMKAGEEEAGAPCGGMCPSWWASCGRAPSRACGARSSWRPSPTRRGWPPAMTRWRRRWRRSPAQASARRRPCGV